MLESILKFLKDLVSSPVNPDKASHTKLWSNVGMAAMTYVFLRQGHAGTLTEWYMWAFAAVVAAPQLISELISLRWGVSARSNKEESDEEKSNGR